MTDISAIGPKELHVTNTSCSIDHLPLQFSFLLITNLSPGAGPPDDRYIRAETCMFMIKLPQYSSQQVMTERLRYAVHCREDPLSG